ncbi:MAG: zinc ABC transporter substrate-binding protein [Desulfobacterales bacterium]|nr:zinc ABC transporter substrate-binding protein [Desulfobacterales bacterium]
MLKKITITLGVFFLFCISYAIAQNTPEKLTVVTTLFPTYDFAKQVGKDKVNVTLLLPPGVEAHSFAPTPKDIVTIKKADVFVYTGEFMEPWASDILSGIYNDNLLVVDSSTGIELMDEADHDDHHTDAHGGGHAFEWAGAFRLSPGEYAWTFAKVDGDYADPKMKMVILSSNLDGVAAIEDREEKAEGLMESHDVTKQVHGDTLSSNESKAYQLVFDPDRNITEYRIIIEKEGVYTFFTEHMPFEFETNEHFFKDTERHDIEPIAQEPDTGHHHHHHGGKDPHIWVDLGHAQKMVDSITRAFVERDPDNKDFYQNNASAYKAKLAELDTRFRKILSTAKHKTIIYGGHFAFGYLAKRYGLTHESPYEGFAPNAEPSPKAIAQLISNLRASGQKYIYYEELIDPKVARIIAEETGATLELLHGAHNVSKNELKAGITFLDIMNDNLQKLKVGLESQ